jgi:hypothetical protein
MTAMFCLFVLLLCFVPCIIFYLLLVYELALLYNEIGSGYTYENCEILSNSRKQTDIVQRNLHVATGNSLQFAKGY